MAALPAAEAGPPAANDDEPSVVLGREAAAADAPEESAWVKRTVGLHSSGGVGMQAGGADLHESLLLAGNHHGAVVIASEHSYEGGGAAAAKAGAAYSASRLRRWSDFVGPAGTYISPRERNMGILGSVANTMNAVIGTGILALPVAFSNVGWALGSGLLTLCTLLCFVSLTALGQVVTTVGGTSYGDTMDKAVGPTCATCISVIVFMYTWGICVVYHVIVSTNITDLLREQDLVVGEIIPGLENRRFWILATTIGTIVPLCMLPNFDRLKYHLRNFCAMIRSPELTENSLRTFLRLSCHADATEQVCGSG
jgi:hypothetical protein